MFGLVLFILAVIGCLYGFSVIASNLGLGLVLIFVCALVGLWLLGSGRRK